MDYEWIKQGNIYTLTTDKGIASIDPCPIKQMTVLIIKDKGGVSRDGYSQQSQPLEREKRIAESRLEGLN